MTNSPEFGAGKGLLLSGGSLGRAESPLGLSEGSRLGSLVLTGLHAIKAARRKTVGSQRFRGFVVTGSRSRLDRWH
jgi:hypothetical protein